MVAPGPVPTARGGGGSSRRRRPGPPVAGAYRRRRRRRSRRRRRRVAARSRRSARAPFQQHEARPDRPARASVTMRPSQSTGVRPYVSDDVVLGRDRRPSGSARAGTDRRRRATSQFGKYDVLHDDRHADLVDVERDRVGVLGDVGDLDRVEPRARRVSARSLDVDPRPVLRARLPPTACRAASSFMNQPRGRALPRAELGIAGAVGRRRLAEARRRRARVRLRDDRFVRRAPARASEPRDLVDLPALRVETVAVGDRSRRACRSGSRRPSPAASGVHAM